MADLYVSGLDLSTGRVVQADEREVWEWHEKGHSGDGTLVCLECYHGADTPDRARRLVPLVPRGRIGGVRQRHFAHPPGMAPAGGHSPVTAWHWEVKHRLCERARVYVHHAPLPVVVALRSQSRLRLEGQTRTRAIPGTWHQPYRVLWFEQSHLAAAPAPAGKAGYGNKRTGTFRLSRCADPPWFSCLPGVRCGHRRRTPQGPRRGVEPLLTDRLLRPDILPNSHESCERYAQSPVAADSRWLLRLLSPLLSGPTWHTLVRTRIAVDACKAWRASLGIKQSRPGGRCGSCGVSPSVRSRSPFSSWLERCRGPGRPSRRRGRRPCPSTAPWWTTRRPVTAWCPSGQA